MKQITWTLFERAIAIAPDEAEIASVAHDLDMPIDAVRTVFRERIMYEEIWKNSLYQIAIDRQPEQSDRWPKLIHLSIKRLDRQPIHDWRHLQRIKNELVGPEHEAIELYPAEERLVDTANQFHLWVFADAMVRAPFGFRERLVTDASSGKGRQRPRS